MGSFPQVPLPKPLLSSIRATCPSPFHSFWSDHPDNIWIIFPLQHLNIYRPHICICSEQKYTGIVKIAMNKGTHLHCILIAPILVNICTGFVINFHHVLLFYLIKQQTVWPTHLAGIEQVHLWFTNFCTLLVAYYIVHTPPALLTRWSIMDTECRRI